MVKLTRADQLKMDAHMKKTIPGKFKSIDFYDTDILGKTPRNSKSVSGNQKPCNKSKEDELKFGSEFHEQFFS